MKKTIPILFALLLAGCSVGFQKEHGRWVYATWDEGRGHRTEPIAGADQETFQLLRGDYARDRRRVYWATLVVAGADPATFECLGDDYARDRAKVFWQQEEVKGADPGSFRVVDGSQLHSRDARHVFLGATLIPGADPETFHHIRGRLDWSRDRKDFYDGARPVGVSDPESFTFVNDGWAHDRAAFYAVGPTHHQNFGKVACDVGTMKVLNESYAVDASRAYYGATPLAGADAKTFRVTSIFSAEDRFRKYQFDHADTRPAEAVTNAPPPATLRKFLIGR